jgi:16S rRNA processing protein RimM
VAYYKHILLGKITKIYGFDGAVTIRLERNISDKIPQMESVFIEIDGRPVPFFIEHAEQTDPLTCRLIFSGYGSIDKIKEFIGCRIYLTDTEIHFSQFEDPLSLIDYSVLSEDNIIIGVIKEIIENPGQSLLNVKSMTGKNILLPFHSDLIKNIDTENKVIQMVIPEGIGEIN